MRLIGVWAAAVVLCLALVLVPSRYGVVDAIQLDIHIKLDDATNDLVMKLGREITRLAPHNQVDFDTLAEPHVTLYLADFPFAHILDLIETVKQAAPLFHRCPVTLNNTVVSGISLFIFYLLYLVLLLFNYICACARCRYLHVVECRRDAVLAEPLRYCRHGTTWCGLGH